MPPAAPSPALPPALPESPLLAGITPGAARRLVAALHPAVRRYEKGEALVLAGYENRRIGLVLDGRIEAVRPGPEGEQLAMAAMGPGGVFGDVLSGSNGHKSPVTVLARGPVTALWLPCEAVLAGPADPALRDDHLRMLRNWVGMLADKYFALDARIGLLMTRSLRRRVLLYVAGLPAGADGWALLPPTRTQLAAYLGCNRAALCRELARMQRDGLLAVAGRRAKILCDEKTAEGDRQDAAREQTV